MHEILRKLLEIFLNHKVAPAIGEEIKAQNQSKAALIVIGVILFIFVLSILLTVNL